MDFEVRHVDGTTVKLISSEHRCAITSATQTRKLCGNDTVTINLQSATYIDFYVGDKITIFGTTYTLNQLPTVKKESERSYSYTLVFEGLQYTLIDRVFLMPDNTQGDNLMFDLAGMLDVLDDNINRGNSGKQYVFELDESLEETEYKNLSLTGKNCLQVLQQLCQEWDTEFVFAEEPNRIAIYIGVAGSTFPTTFKYGRGGGVYELNREKGASDICTRLFVYGGTQNLTYYRHNRLCLPSKEKNQSYVEDATAQAVYGIKEQVKHFDDIYPNRIGTITSLSGCDYNEFIDSAMADSQFGFDLNEKWANNADDCAEWLALKGLEDTEANRTIYYNDVAGTATKYLMAGATAKIHFNTGMLAGYECDLHSYTHSSQKFVLKPLVDENGYDFPSKTNAAFKLAVGDEYVILDINLPTAYKTQAESKLATEAASYFDTVCRPQPKYTLTIEPIALKHIVGPSTADTEIFKVGDLINISDPTGGVESATIRIDQFVRNLLDPFDYKLTLTDEITYSQQVRTLIEVDAIKRVVEESKIYDVNRIRRGWKDAEELYNQMFDTEGHYYSEKIAPLSIDTQMLKVGARSQQLVLQNVLFQPNYNADPANLQISAGSLVHYTIDEPDIKTWTMSAYSGSNVPSTAQYVYAKCAKNGTTGTWLVTGQAIIFDSDPSYYHFLVGSLSSVDSVSNTRNFAATYGFTTINGRNITTGVIKSADGSGVIIDLDAGIIKGDLRFESGSQGQQIIENLINETVDAEVGALGVANRNLIGETSIDKRVPESGTATSGWQNQKYPIYGLPFTSGETLTLQADITVHSGTVTACDIAFYDTSGNYLWNTRGQISGGKILLTFTANSAIAGISAMDLYFFAGVMGGTSGNAITISHLKVERGDTKTDWSVAPEDVGVAIDTANAANNKIDNLAIGGRNLLLYSGVRYSNNAYNITTYVPSSYLVAGEEYTVSIKITPASDVSYICPYLSGGYQAQAYMYVNGTSTQIIKSTFTARYYGGRTPSDNPAYGHFQIYRFPNNGSSAGVTTIDWIKVEKGNKATDWTPAPEDPQRTDLKGTCSTAAGTATKVISCAGWSNTYLESGTRISVEMSYDGLAYGSAVGTYHPLLSIGGTTCYLYYKGQYSGYGYQHETPAIWAAGMEVKLEYMGMSGTITYGSSTLESRHAFRIIDEGEFDSAVIFSKALKGQTDIFGGLILTETMLMRDEGGRQRAGMSGIGGIALFAGGTMYQAQNGTAKVIITHTGDAKFGVVNINGSGNGEMTMDSGGARRLTIKNEGLTLSQGGVVYNSRNDQNDNTPDSGTALNGAQVSTTEQTHTIFALTMLQSPTNKYLFDVHLTISKLELQVTTAGTAGYVQLNLDFYNGNEWENFYVLELDNSRAGTRTVNNLALSLRYNNTGLGYAQIGLRARYKTTASSAGQSTATITQPKWYYYCDNNKANMQIANNGLTYYLNSANQFTAKTNNDQSMTIDLKGNVNISGSSISMPGVLVAARVGGNGGWFPKYLCNGKTMTDCTRTSTGKYKLTFTGFTEAPAVIATAYSNASSYYTGATVYANAVSSGVLTIEIHTRNNDSLTDTDFYIVLLGTN